MMRVIRRGAFGCRARERGAAAVEFAIVFPLLVLFTLGLIGFGRLIWTQATLDYAVQAAARCYALGHGIALATCQTAAQAQQYATVKAPGLSLAISVFTVTMQPCGAQVTASLPFRFLVPALLPYSQTLHANACFPI